MHRLLLIASAAAFALGAALPTAAETMRQNPFFAPSELPFQAPPFDRIERVDYRPAFAEGMRRHLAEIEAIANNPEPATFDNTLVAMERAGQLLERVTRVFFALAGANSDPALQAIQTKIAPQLAAHQDAVYLNGKLFARVEALHRQRGELPLDPESLALIERYYRDFVLAGAALPAADKARLKALNEEASALSTEFQQRLLAANKESAPVFSHREALAGLSEAELAAAARTAEERGLPGKWVLALQNTTQQPWQATLKNRRTRQRLFRASIHRTDRGEHNDTRRIVKRLAQLRAEKARLLGFENYASWALADQMAGTPAAAEKLMTDMVPAVMAKARREAERLQAAIRAEGGRFKLAPWDWQYYAEQVRQTDYGFDEAEVKPYFALERVLKDGIFYAAHELYGLDFEERHDLPVYHPDVRVFEVRDAGGEPLALWYADYFRRDNKNGGAWMNSLVGQSSLLGTQPVVTNVCNFARPADGEPALLGFDEVTTMFHEFGHALHAILSQVKYPSLAGTNVPRDFVEFPSQFNEHWALEPAVFAHYARHYQTGEPMPAALVAKIRKARSFNQGFATLEYLEAALLDMAWHTLPAGRPRQDPMRFERAALRRYGVHYPPVPPRYHTTYFAHIWQGGYAARYYAYLWSEVLSADAYAWFAENGGLTRDNGQRFRALILSRGHSGDLAAMYRTFRGRDPVIEPLLKKRGLLEDNEGG